MSLLTMMTTSERVIQKSKVCTVTADAGSEAVFRYERNHYADAASSRQQPTRTEVPSRGHGAAKKSQDVSIKVDEPRFDNY